MANEALLAFVLRLADDHLILGHRLSEWCGHAPMLEEDLAMPNMALDLIGQARALYQYAAEIEGKGRTEDDFAYLRRERDYTNCLMVERANGDFAHTMLRQLYFAAFMEPMWDAIAKSNDATLAGIAEKAVKEVAYHIRHAGEWVIRLGDGTEESAVRMQQAVEDLAPYIDELFDGDEVTAAMAEAGIAPEPASLRAEFDRTVATIFAEAFLDMPAAPFAQRGGRTGRHGEAMGFLLADLQYMQRTYPGAVW
ncbi:phenylacetate-CoA oxygenase subunit PaaC [Aliihoeflea aestuarii]|jgi:ring-1,2-phenylacetyl-CoA epoxidase subunit PaaC|uniref:1,2-phenylacetyl-CoA epoxidase subunit PaaC n=1 Tax=Aliihoeflea aestuarii TaxID=453840 RepID=UPI0020950E75|nr:1,2-phenylacetyl-CoA epoxidase subunit PaaC [Aliihoeflea aestuarii]MCO6392207.1 phenylacetate-CoA oxygenase subunit PaaC [Aliihoeflea aestuarii]